MKSSEGVWGNHSRQWAKVGPPLRPSKQDHKILNNVIAERASNHEILRALILGVSPEMARLNWPYGTELLAVDKSQKMIDSVWPGYPNPGEGVLCANWLDLPFVKHSWHLAVSDGPFGVLRYPHEYSGVLKELRRVLMPGGVFAFRIFVRPENNETASEVYEDTLGRKIGNFHAFKLRLLMAMQINSETGVRTGDVWEEWNENGPGSQKLSETCGWPEEQMQTIEAYQGQQDIYCFPTLREIRNTLEKHSFEILSCTEPAYELGDRCPTITCRV